MSFFLAFLSIVLVARGAASFYQSVRYRNNQAYFKLWQLKVPFWFCKMAASVFVVFLGVFVMVQNI